MNVALNHTIVWCSDKVRSANFLVQVLGLPPPVPFMHFLVVKLDNEVSLDYYEKAGAIAKQHYAFLVGDHDFDAAFARINEARLNYWADPARSQANEINHHFGGRGFYIRAKESVRR